jgi:adenylate cyclase class 2
MSAHGTENEIKLRVESARTAETLLRSHRFSVTRDRVFEVNRVYDTPDRLLRRKNNVLRVREAGSSCILTLKGSAANSSRHKSRTECETGVSDAAALDKILGGLGYQCVFRYEKYRTEYQRAGEPGTAMLDETPIGIYLELEGPPEWVDSTAAELGYASDRYITASYGTLYHQHCRQIGVVPSHMVFGDLHYT